MVFIITNQLHNTITNAALRITALTTPSILPTKYIGIKILVAGSNTVYVSTAEADISSTASAISA